MHFLTRLSTAGIFALLTSTVVSAEPSAVVGNGWNLVWSDEFDGTSIDTSKWSWETNCWGGGNNELQCYTDRPENSFVQDGKLVIHAQPEIFTGPAEPVENGESTDQRTLPYTSARLRTRNQGDWTFGRIEVRAKLPAGQGIWPAIWMLPTDNAYGTWAASGEIDIMEAVNLTDDAIKQVHGTLHYGREWPANVSSGTHFDFTDSDPTTTFHTYAIEWGSREIRWYVDDLHYATQRSSGWYTQIPDENGDLTTLPAGAPFDQRFHLLLNVAVGGNWPGEPDVTTPFPAEMEIDFVRVFSCVEAPETLSACATKNRRATRVFGNLAPEIVKVEYNPDLMESDVVTIYGDADLPPYALGQFVANGSVAMNRVPEDGRGEVTELVFNTDESVVYWQAPVGLDISGFSRVQFDMKVIVDPRDNGGYVMKVDCFFPCGTGDVPVPNVSVGEWHRHSFDLAKLVTHPGSSLDLTNVNTPLVIFPDWGNQNGVVMRIDNVQLIK